jgi:hypothetical protein
LLGVSTKRALPAAAATPEDSFAALVASFEAYSKQLSDLRAALVTSQAQADGLCASLLTVAETVAPLASSHAGLGSESSEHLNATTSLAEDLLPALSKAMEVGMKHLEYTRI